MEGNEIGIEQISPSLVRIGSSIALDGRVSWAPEIPGGRQPINCYVKTEDGLATVIETGVAAHRPKVIAELKETVPADRPLLVFVTRTELECSGNLTAIVDSFDVDKVIFGGGANPFDAYDEVTRGANTNVARQSLPPAGEMITPLGDSRTLLLVPARIRILTTYWLYDKQSKTLFSSDVFGHTSMRSGEAAILDSIEDDESTLESARRHILKKFFWLPEARTHLLKQWLEAIFEQCDVEIIAPSHGRVLRGRRLVEKHYTILQDVLSAPKG